MKCLIIDDDPLICDLLRHFCSKVDDISSITTTNSGFESINLINSHSFDIVFLDYNLPDLTGKDILEVIDQSAVVMVTSHKDFASESYNYDVIVDYLVKPIDFSRFFKSIQKVQGFLAHKTDKLEHLFIKDGNKLVKVKWEEILYFKSEANYISVAMENRKILTLMTLKELEKKLPTFFQRVHRSYIININKVDSIEMNNLTIAGLEIPISDSYEKQFYKRINLLN